MSKNQTFSNRNWAFTSLVHWGILDPSDRDWTQSRGKFPSTTEDALTFLKCVFHSVFNVSLFCEKIINVYNIFWSDPPQFPPQVQHVPSQLYPLFFLLNNSFTESNKSCPYAHVYAHVYACVYTLVYACVYAVVHWSMGYIIVRMSTKKNDSLPHKQATANWSVPQVRWGLMSPSLIHTETI